MFWFFFLRFFWFWFRFWFWLWFWLRLWSWTWLWLRFWYFRNLQFWNIYNWRIQWNYSTIKFWHFNFWSIHLHYILVNNSRCSFFNQSFFFHSIFEFISCWKNTFQSICHSIYFNSFRS